MRHSKGFLLLINLKVHQTINTNFITIIDIIHYHHRHGDNLSTCFQIKCVDIYELSFLRYYMLGLSQSSSLYDAYNVDEWKL